MRDICICACMSKKKMSEDVIQPSIKTTSDMTWTSSSYESWKSSSVSSRSSMSSLRESLPHENPHLYHFKEIFSATNGFLAPKYSSSSSSYSSSSSSSGAWRCVIRGDDVIVFQRKLRRPIEESELRERLVVICKSHHSSLIKLRGASMSGSYIYLVYDYVKGASLADCLRNPNNPHFTVLSDWMSRIQVAADVAHGLDYIHNSTGLHRRFVHNHIKSSSVIVAAQSSRAKICHFGTAELCGEAECMKFEGTRGYMSPEFQATGRATQKSDVYALGVVVLEILSGEEALKYTRPHKGHIRRVSLIETAREAAEGCGLGLRRWMDPRLKDSFPEEVALKLAHLGLMCVEDDPDKRPDISWLTGRISKLYLDSRTWTEKMGPLPQDFTVSMAPR